MRERRGLSWLLTGLALLPVLLDLVSSARPLAAAPALPSTGAGFVGRDVRLSAVEHALLGRIPATKKAYSIGEHQVVVLCFDASVDRHVIHEPTYCLRGKNWRVVRDDEREVPCGRVRLLRAVQSGKSLVRRYVCFYQAGDRWYTSTWTYLADFVWTRWWPGRTPPLRRVIVLCSSPNAPGEDWIVDVVLPRLFGQRPQAEPGETSAAAPR